MLRFVLSLVCLLLFSMTSVHAATLEGELGRSLKDGRGTVIRALTERRAGRMPSPDLARLKLLRDEVAAITLLRVERRASVADLAVRGGRAEHHEAVNDALDNALSELLSLIDAALAGGDAAHLENLLSTINRLIPTKSRPLHGTLPYRQTAYAPGEPATAPALTPAYRGGNGQAVDADTAASPEAPLSPAIVAHAQSLQWNPVLIYEWVKNNVATEWYRGVMKGADETLRQRSGNDADQASLLAALLRASGFPSRFVRGTIELFPDLGKAVSLTGIDDPQQILLFLQKVGIPCKPVIAGGRIVNFQLEHVWVESQVPYSNYRGAVIDGMGKTWLGLDTSIKPHGLSWNSSPALPDSLFASLRDEYLQTLRGETPLEAVRAKTEEYLQQNSPGGTYQEHLSRGEIIPDVLKILPSSLQFKQIAITGEYQSLPDDLKHKLTITTKAGGNELFSTTIETHRLSNRKLALRAEPETVEDQNLIDSFGGLDNTPAYLVRLRPTLTLDGERLIVARDGLPMGSDFTLDIDIVTPSGSERITSTQINGNLAVIGVVGQQATAPAPISDQDDAETILHKEAIGYIDRWNKGEEELAALLGQRLSRPTVTIATVGNQLAVTTLLDTPHDLQWQGVYMDAGYRRVAVAGNIGTRTQFLQLSALEGSVLEHRIFEDDLKVDSVSTAKLLQQAHDAGTPIVTIDKSNSDALLPTLSFDDAVKADIADAVGQGLIVTVPQAEVAYRDWLGIGYIKENPVTGEAGWMLSGQIAGGMSTIRKEEWQRQDLLNPLLVPYSVKPNDDPGAIRKIARITASDYQDGTVGKVLPQPLQVLALDAGGKPVVNVPIVFSIIAGDGSLAADAAGAGSATIKEYRVLTGANGVASAYLLMGKQTAASPIYVQRAQTYAIQVGQNLVAARAEIPGGSLSLDKPFEANGFPGDAVKLTKVAASATDDKWGVPGLFAGSVWVQVSDEFDNPVSNKQVTFTVKPQKYRAIPPPVATDTVKIINAKLLPTDSSCPGSPSLDCSIAADEIPVLSSIIGANAAVVLGNTEQTDFFLEARAYRDENGKEATVLIAPALFTYHTSGWSSSSDDTAATFLTANINHHLDSLGNRIDAGKAGAVFTKPLSVTLYRSEEISVLATKENCSANCYYLRGTGVYQTTRVDNGTVEFTAGQGGGAVTPAIVSAAASGQPGTPVANGVYSTTLTLGQQPGINRVSIKGSATLPVKRINRGSGELYSIDATDTAFASFDIWGVLPQFVPGQWILINSKGYPTADVPLQFSVLPAEYPVGSMAVRFYENGLWQYMGEVSVKKSGDVLSAGGAVFDPAKRYDARLSLFNAALESDPVTFTVAAIDLDIDSDNKSGVNADATHKDPVHSAATEEIEATPGLPGKFIPLNTGDRNGDAIPDFADGYDLQTAQPVENGSAAFIPLLISIPEPIDLAQARLRFHYNASDPAAVTQHAGEDGKVIFTPTPEGRIRLWRKDGILGRLKASVANGGDYLKPGEVLTVGHLGAPVPGRERTWRLFVEGVALSSQIGEELIRVDVDPDGNGTAPFMIADEVRTTVNKAVLITDFNRDRTIDGKDIMLAAGGETFYFWINDDTDSGEISDDSDVPGEKTLLQKYNWEDDHINGTSDLEDFFPVQLDIRELLKQYSPSSYTYMLKHADSAVNMAFVLKKALLTQEIVLGGLTPAESGKYLIDAREGGVAKGIENQKTFQVTAKGLVLNNHLGNPGFLQRIIDEDKGVILLEGRKETSAPLELSIVDNNGKEIFISKLNISIAGVEQMFRQKNLIREMYNVETVSGLQSGGAIPIPGHPMPENVQDRGEPDRLEAGDFRIKGHFEGFDKQNIDGDYVHVHGYNIDSKASRGEHSVVFKRLFWSGSKAKFWGITWYGYDSRKNLSWLCMGLRSPNYHVNVRHAYNAGILLKEFADTYLPSTTTFAAHSLGNMVVSTAIKKGLKYKQYFMLNAAVAEEDYVPEELYANEIKWQDNTRKMMYEAGWRYPYLLTPTVYDGYKPGLWASEWYKLFKADPADDRKKLTWRGFFQKVQEDASVYAFFAPTDQAFRPYEYTLDDVDNKSEFTSYPDSPRSSYGLWAFLVKNWLPGCLSDKDKIGTYSWAVQELTKGQTPFADSDHGGWGFNTANYGPSYCQSIVGVETVDKCLPLAQIPPVEANPIYDDTALRSSLKTKPLFDMKPEHNDIGLFSGLAVALTESKQVELLANEIPALTYAVGHRGTGVLQDKNIDIRDNYVKGSKAPWPRKPLDRYEWRHSDLFDVAYPYVYRIYDDWVSIIKLGVSR